MTEDGYEARTCPAGPLGAVGPFLFSVGALAVRRPLALELADQPERCVADVPQPQHGAWGLSVASGQATDEASLAGRLRGMVKPSPRVHDVDPVGGSRSTWHPQE